VPQASTALPFTNSSIRKYSHFVALISVIHGPMGRALKQPIDLPALASLVHGSIDLPSASIEIDFVGWKEPIHCVRLLPCTCTNCGSA
jgi:hypothetical protein